MNDRLARVLRDEWKPFMLIFAVTMVAKGAALLPGYSIDDWWPTTDGPASVLSDLLWKGRFGHWLFLHATIALQAAPNPARVLHVAFSMAAYSAFALAVVRYWGFRRSSWPVVAAAALIANHPYTCEIFSFRIGLPLAGMVLALLAVLFATSTLGAARLWLGALLFAAAISLYPIALHFGLMAVGVGLAIDLHSRTRLGAPTERSGPTGERWIDRERWRSLGMMVLGLLLYAGVAALLSSLLHLPGDYFGLMSAGELPERGRLVAATLVNTFVAKNALIPAVVRGAFFVLLLIAFLGTFGRRGSGLRAAARFGALSGLALLLVGCATWSLGLFLLLDRFWPSPRSMAHVGILWAGVLLMASESAGRLLTRRLLGLITAAIIISFVAVNQGILEDQRRLNMRDVDLANRIIYRLETTPGFVHVRRIAVAGRRPTYRAGSAATQWGDMNISAFGAVWSQVPVLEEASGYDLAWSTNPTEQAAAAAFCGTSPPWPAASSIAIRGQFAIVCLGGP